MLNIEFETWNTSEVRWYEGWWNLSRCIFATLSSEKYPDLDLSGISPRAENRVEISFSLMGDNEIHVRERRDGNEGT